MRELRTLAIGTKIHLTEEGGMILEEVMGDMTQLHLEIDETKKVHLRGNTPVFRVRGGFRLGSRAKYEQEEHSRWLNGTVMLSI